MLWQFLKKSFISLFQFRFLNKRLFALFFLTGLLYFLPSDLLVFSEKEQVVPSIRVTDKENGNIEVAVEKMLDLQKSLLSSPNPAKLTYQQQNKGFLLFQMRPEYVKGLIQESHAKIIGAYQGEELVGYVFLTAVQEFKKLFQDPNIGWFENFISPEELGDVLSLGPGYVQQIAVSLNSAKTGIGRSLIQRCKEISPQGLVADVFIEPVNNKASLAFFDKMGFQDIGILHQEKRLDFVAYKTRVFLWTQGETAK